MRRTVLFAGGPLHGTTMVTDSTYGVYAMDNSPVDLAVSMAGLSQDWDAVREPVLYRMARLAICGRIIWIGYLGTKPDDDLVFEVMTSDGAKAASNVYEATAHP